MNVLPLSTDSDERSLQRLEKCRSHFSQFKTQGKQAGYTDVLDYILKQTLDERFTQTVYVRKRGSLFRLRIQKVPDNPVFDAIPSGQTVFIAGHLRGQAFYINEITLERNPDKIRADEKECEVSVLYDREVQPSQIDWLYKILKDDAFPQEADEEIDPQIKNWNDYLDWRITLTKKQCHGIKCLGNFIRSTGKGKEADNFVIGFYVCGRSKEEFEKSEKYLKRDICLFTNEISASRTYFNVLSLRGIPRADCIEPGDFCNIEEVPKEQFENLPNSNLLKNISAPYVAIATYKLGALKPSNEQVKEFLEEEGKNKSFESFIENHVKQKLEKFFKKQDGGKQTAPNLYDGFLGTSAVGDFALLRRLQYAVKDFNDGKSYSENLSDWLFNIKKARKPCKDSLIKIADEDFLNQDLVKNKNQKEAVLKMLNIQDVGLIQGPPGTGKTTVIAEIVYQAVRRGMKVLIASQSNDAVDNALDRLQNVPEIRAVRLATRQLKKQAENDDEPEKSAKKKYSEENLIDQYYDSMARTLKKNYIDKWEDLDGENFDQRIKQAEYEKSDIIEHFKRLGEENVSLKNLREEYSAEKAKNETLKENQKNAALSEVRLKDVKNALSCGEYGDLFLTAPMVKVAEAILNTALQTAADEGIRLTEHYFSKKLSLDSASTVLKTVVSGQKSVFDCVNKMLATGGSADAAKSIEQENLERELSQIKQKMGAEDDDEKLSALLKKRKEVQKKLNALGSLGKIQVPQIVKNCLAPDLADRLVKQDKDTAAKLKESLQKLFAAERNFVEECAHNAENEKRTVKEKLDQSERNFKRLGGQIKVKKETAQNLQRIIQDKEASFAKTCRLESGFDFATNESDLEKQLASQIKNLRKQKEETLLQTAEIQKVRSVWQDSIKKFVEKLQDKDQLDYDKQDGNYTDLFIANCNVVGVSCTTNTKKLEDKGYVNFDLVIIDEVSKATPVELLIPLMRAKKAILVGDHRQLPPMFKEHEQSYKEMFNLKDGAGENEDAEIDESKDLEQSDEIPDEIKQQMTVENFRKYEKMVTSSLFKEYFENAPSSLKCTLLTQYRMHPDISAVINRFYENRLIDGMTGKDAEQKKNHGLELKGADGTKFVQKDRHAYWLDSSKLPDGTPAYESFRKNSTSAVNVFEQYLVIELLKKLAAGYKAIKEVEEAKRADDPSKIKYPVQVGIISFYQRQVNEIRRRVKAEMEHNDFSCLDIDVNTVDRFQGKEKNVIIASLVRNNKDARASKHIVAFERINVAFSRAQNLLFIVGAQHMYEKQKVSLPNMDSKGFRGRFVYKDIYSLLRQEGCFFTSEKVLDKSAVSRYKKEAEE